MHRYLKALHTFFFRPAVKVRWPTTAERVWRRAELITQARASAEVISEQWARRDLDNLRVFPEGSEARELRARRVLGAEEELRRLRHEQQRASG